MRDNKPVLVVAEIALWVALDPVCAMTATMASLVDDVSITARVRELSITRARSLALATLVVLDKKTASVMVLLLTWAVCTEFVEPLTD